MKKLIIVILTIVSFQLSAQTVIDTVVTRVTFVQSISSVQEFPHSNELKDIQFIGEKPKAVEPKKVKHNTTGKTHW